MGKIRACPQSTQCIAIRNQGREVGIRKALIIAIAIAGTFFGGCTPMVVTSNSGLVVIDNASAFNASKAQTMADAECQKHGKYAIHRPDNVRDGQALFECID